MIDRQEGSLDPEVIVGKMKEHSVTHVVWLPDSETNHLFLRLQEEPSLELVGVAREGIACSIAAGLHAGGARPIILIQNTGLLECGDSVRGWLLGLKIPVVLLVGYRGYNRHGPEKDSAATYTERFLMAFNLSYYQVEDSADADRISIAFEEAERTRLPVVVLVADEFHDFGSGGPTR